MNDNVKLKSDYKKRLEVAAFKLSAEAEERVTIAKIVYRLIDNHLDDVVEEIKNEHLMESKS